MSDSVSPLRDHSQLSDQLGDRLLVLFDGHCGLCHASVRWLMRHDRQDRLRFAPADSPAARALLAAVFPASTHPYPIHFASATPDTILVLTPPTAAQDVPHILTRSTAVLACLNTLDTPWPQFAALALWIPLPLRDAAYRLVARLRLFPRYAICPLLPSQHMLPPQPETLPPAEQRMEAE